MNNVCYVFTWQDRHKDNPKLFTDNFRTKFVSFRFGFSFSFLILTDSDTCDIQFVSRVPSMKQPRILPFKYSHKQPFREQFIFFSIVTPFFFFVFHILLFNSQLLIVVAFCSVYWNEKPFIVGKNCFEKESVNIWCNQSQLLMTLTFERAHTIDWNSWIKQSKTERAEINTWAQPNVILWLANASVQHLLAIYNKPSSVFNWTKMT